VANYDRAITLEPGYPDTFFNRGNALHALNRFDDALASHDHAIMLKPDYAEAFNNRGVALKELNRIDDALANFDKVVALKPDYTDAFNNRGVALQELKRFEEAVASYTSQPFSILTTSSPLADWRIARSRFVIGRSETSFSTRCADT
jgi:tetratricopeptide (TPR) repeat protein